MPRGRAPSETPYHATGTIHFLALDFGVAAARRLAVEGEFIDTGVSGAQPSGPARNKLLEAVRLRQIDLVLVLRLDRWGRAVADCVCPQGGGKLTDAAVHDIDNVGVQGVRKGDDRRVGGGGCEEGAGSRQALRLSPAFPGGTASLS